MMVKAFGVFFEFNPEEYDRKIQSLVAEKQKGYSCIIDGNVLTMAHKDEEYRDILNNASVNTCDGSSIAAIASRIHKKKYKSYNGPEIFKNYVQKPYKQVIVGNTEERVATLNKMLKEKGYSHQVSHIQVPFMNVEDFDYEVIAEQLNNMNAQLIWISLGAPKQERFISRLLPYINNGILFGAGAAINFYIGEAHNSEKNFAGIRFIWLERLFKEPKKQIKRVIDYLKILPKLYFQERKACSRSL